jgi:RNA polymerase sigma factor (TIGR02999 family)
MKPTLAALLAAAERGDAEAGAALFSALYAELHRLARRQLGRNRNLTLGTTTLLHEAYLNMSQREGVAFPDQGHFMAYAARVMRGIVIDYVRSRGAQKRGGQFHLTPLIEDLAGPEACDRQLTRISDSLDELATIDPLLAQVVDLKFFCGFSFAEIATMRQVSERTVQRHWEKARIFLRRALRAADAS